jgi:tRNA-2-methylthio-N6-dimethylallyladenosine synthase
MKTVFFKTLGCQMNEYDTLLMESILAPAGYCVTTEENDADAIIVNTCSVRNHAEERAFAQIQRLVAAKKKNRKLIIAGCMAKRLGNELISMFPGIDFVVGPDQYELLPSLLNSTKAAHCVETGNMGKIPYSGVFTKHESSVSASIAIMRGCNNYCSYCIVPYVRGKERSRPLAEIIAEVE